MRIDPEVKDAAAAVIVGAIADSERKKIAEDAIQWLLKGDASPWGNGMPPLTEAARRAIIPVAESMLRELFEADERTREHVRGIYAEAVQRLFDPANREEYVSRVAGELAFQLFRSHD